MKKFAVLALSAAMVFSLAGCGKNNNKETTTEITEEAVKITDSLEILTNVWGTYADDEKFSIAGGDYNNSVMDAPGKFDVSDGESLDSMLGVPQDSAALIDGAASMMHMMNANTFTAGAYHMADAANQDAFCTKLKDNIMNRQWMCGFPDTLIIYTVAENYVVAAFGNAEAIESFKTKLATVYGEGATLNVEESLA